jgi:hypothetical protein
MNGDDVGEIKCYDLNEIYDMAQYDKQKDDSI